MPQVKDMSLAPEGHKKINWVKHHMKVLPLIKKQMEERNIFHNVRIGMSIHLEAKTAYLALTLKELGAFVAITSSNPLSTQDDVAAALADSGIEVFAWRGETPEEYMENQKRVLKTEPNLILDDGLDLTTTVVESMPELASNIWGASEETTTGVHRARALAQAGKLPYPLIALNDAYIKYLFDNRYGTGESVPIAISRGTNLLIAGKTVVIAGYGWCGRGVARVMKGMGAHTIVTEIDPIRALEAIYDGHQVMTMDEAAKIGDIFVTTTGMKNVIRCEHLLSMKDGAILSNAGHFNVEIDVKYLEENSKEKWEARQNVTAYKLSNGKTLYLLGEGRLVNLVVGDGHPAEIMDLSFSAQILALAYLIENKGQLDKKVYNLPHHYSVEIAEYKLKSMGIEIDKLDEEQIEYLSRW